MLSASRGRIDGEWILHISNASSCPASEAALSLSVFELFITQGSGNERGLDDLKALLHTSSHSTLSFVMSPPSQGLLLLWCHAAGSCLAYRVESQSTPHPAPTASSPCSSAALRRRPEPCWVARRPCGTRPRGTRSERYSHHQAVSPQNPLVLCPDENEHSGWTASRRPECCTDLVDEVHELRLLEHAVEGHGLGGFLELAEVEACRRMHGGIMTVSSEPKCLATLS